MELVMELVKLSCIERMKLSILLLLCGCNVGGCCCANVEANVGVEAAEKKNVVGEVEVGVVANSPREEVEVEGTKFPSRPFCTIESIAVFIVISLSWFCLIMSMSCPCEEEATTNVLCAATPW